MIRLTEALGLPVLSRASAERLGELRHLVLDAPAHRVVTLHVAGRGRRARFVDWAAVVGAGSDAIVVSGEEALRPPRNDLEVEVAKGHLDLEDRLVLDDRGDSPGTLSDLGIDEASGTVADLLCGGDRIDGGRLRSLGPFCIVVLALRTVAGEPAAATG